jgi:hypothetical protein
VTVIGSAYVVADEPLPTVTAAVVSKALLLVVIALGNVIAAPPPEEGIALVETKPATKFAVVEPVFEVVGGTSEAVSEPISVP